eukprot:TRINITY_DN88786_c0_g1_i1.p1 TRINITY_DN88786_c0_g1~~TRINITY_DN88786_c0_g1_i1.p1  ORF type:complete len:538 (+),score=89.82 TRINITY_DN88786_c0_g1_i1:35-1648(+)
MDGPFASFVSSLGSTGSIHFKSSKRYPGDEPAPSGLSRSNGRRFDASRSWGEKAQLSVDTISESEASSQRSSSSSSSSSATSLPALASASSSNWEEISTDTGDAEGFSTSAQARLPAQSQGSSRFATEPTSPTSTKDPLEPGEIPDPFHSAPAEIFVGSMPRGLHRQSTASGLPTRHGSVPPGVEREDSSDESDDDSITLEDAPFKPFFAARREISEEYAYPSYDESHAKTRVGEVPQTQFQPEAQHGHTSAGTKLGSSPSSPLQAAREAYFAAQRQSKPADTEPIVQPRRSICRFHRFKEVVRGKLEGMGAIAKGATEALRSLSPKPRSFVRRRSRDSGVRRDGTEPFAQTPPQMPAGDKPIPTPPKEKKFVQPPRSAKAEDDVPRPGSKERKGSKESSPRSPRPGPKGRKGSKSSESSPRSPGAGVKTARTPFKDLLKTAAVPGDATAIERLDKAVTPRTGYEAAEILGLEYRPNGLLVAVSASELRSAYRRAALRWHPDRPIWVRAGEDGLARATAAFHRANVAHELLQPMAET